MRSAGSPALRAAMRNGNRVVRIFVARRQSAGPRFIPAGRRFTLHGGFGQLRSPKFDFHLAGFASHSSFVLPYFVNKIGRESARRNEVFDLSALAELLGRVDWRALRKSGQLLRYI